MNESESNMQIVANLSGSSGSINSNRKEKSLREKVTFCHQDKFDTNVLAPDLQRVFEHLKAKYNEEYALTFVFTMRTAVELHRAWHMTLLTSKILEQIKEKFKLRMTWDLGVFKLKFRVDEGGFEIHRKIQYDYDSEYQDIYTRIAVALIDGHIDIHEALTYQEDTLKGLHTARSGIFIRDFPGRLVLYPFEAATCAVIFFGGDFTDAGVAALCGFATGFVEMCLGFLSGQFRELKILTDVIVGITTGLIGGLFYNYSEEGYCLRSIFLGTLYWFFYGTAFVIGILEIIAGELETGVTRFIAVSVKTFVLSLGAAIGLMLATSSNASTVWFESQDQYCGKLDLSMYWWRIPLYLLCSASVLAQYRFPIVQYWRGLIVQLCAYEVQYQWFAYSQTLHGRDYLDTSTSNILGAAAGVISACILSYIINTVKLFYSQRLLQEKNSKNTKFGNIVFGILALGVNIGQSLHLGRKSDFLKLNISTQLQQQRQEINDTTHPRQEMELSKQEENLILETIVGSQELNVWSILMPALYQLVPGSIIAQLWFNSIFPPDANTDGSDAVFSNLMVISTSLALGLIIGFTSVQVFGSIFLRLLTPGKSHDEKIHALARLAGMYSAPATILDDPVTSGGPNQRSEQDGHSNQGAGRNYSLVDDKQNHHEISVEDPFFPVPLDGDEI